MVMAEEGLPSGGSIGYEIFDRSEGLGTTNFVQNINHVRALEGDLARTIRSIESVKQARVQKNGREHGYTPVTNEPLVCRLMLEKKKNTVRRTIINQIRDHTQKK